MEDRAPTSTLSDPTDPTSPPIDVAGLAQSDCTKSGHLSPGTNGSGGDDAVSGVFWWAASNWRNRITVPLNFAPVGDPCATTGKNGGVEIYGSELLTEATTQWGPHFCANDQLFTLKHVQLGEPLARNLLAQNLQHLQSSSDKVPPGNVEAAWEEQSHGRRGARRRIYQLTRKGKEHLEQGRAEWQRFVTVVGGILGASA